MRVGVDEAGKGPVLGPMVAAAVGVADVGALPDGVADSKRLAAERRERLAERLRADDRVAVGVATVSVEVVDAPATDMNSLTVAGQAAALDAVRGVAAVADGDGRGAARESSGDSATGSDSEAGSDTATGGDSAAGSDSAAGNDARAAPDPELASVVERAAPVEEPDDCAVLADAGDTSEERFARRLREACAGEPSVEARHGADDEDPLVAAASIVAKVERDARVARLAAAYGEVGSGYPSDPTTREFLAGYVREHGELPACARESWRTCDDVLAAAEQSGLDEF